MGRPRPEWCSVEGCDGWAKAPGAALGFCLTHYRRLRRYGDPLAEPTPRQAPAHHRQPHRQHGRTKDPNYRRHNRMMARCYDPADTNYRYYGARGVRVHESWHHVENFCDWLAVNLGPCPEGYSLDRIDNDRGYEPGNVRWATHSEQLTNRRSWRWRSTPA